MTKELLDELLTVIGQYRSRNEVGEIPVFEETYSDKWSSLGVHLYCPCQFRVSIRDQYDKTVARLGFWQ